MIKRLEKASYMCENRIQLGEQVQKRAAAWRAANKALNPTISVEQRQKLIGKIDEALASN